MAQKVLSGALAVWALSYSYCYSDPTIGIGKTDTIEIDDSYKWTMRNVFPPEAGLVVNGVTYRYTVNKDQQSQYSVTVRNENAKGEGYVFNETDDWTGLPGNTINKLVPTDIPGEYFGDGEIVTEGDGQISDPTIAYNYKWDECFEPLSNPACPGFDQSLYDWLLANGFLSAPDINDPFYDEWVQMMLNRETETEEESEEEEEDQKEEEEDEEQSELAQSFFGAADAIAIANAATEQAKMDALSTVPNFDSYAEVTIPGGVYEETVTLQDTKLPDNKRALNNFSQDALHKEMIRSQYD